LSGGTTRSYDSSSLELRSRALRGTIVRVYLLKRMSQARRSLPWAGLDGEWHLPFLLQGAQWWRFLMVVRPRLAVIRGCGFSKMIFVQTARRGRLWITQVQLDGEEKFSCGHWGNPFIGLRDLVGEVQCPESYPQLNWRSIRSSLRIWNSSIRMV
jgi:hypothetical protein